MTDKRDEWKSNIDTTRPSIARAYDVVLNGKDNFEVDRAFVAEIAKVVPEIYDVATYNRQVLGRGVRFLSGQGITRFIDLGSGLPTVENTHQVAQRANPEARVVYVDNDPMVLAHGRAILAVTETTTVIQADIREPDKILDHPEVRRLIDFTEPVGLLLFSILHHLNDDEDPGGIADRLRAALPPGSYVAVSHFHNPGAEHPVVSQQAAEAERIFNENLGTGRWRTGEEILAYFGDMEVLEPGLVPLVEWRPDVYDNHEVGITYYTYVGGVARKP